MAEKKMYKYQVLVGVHAEPLDKVVDKVGVDGKTIQETVRELVMYGEKDYFESTSAFLVERLGADKFLKMPDNFDVNQARKQQTGEVSQETNLQLPSSAINFNDWTEKELRSHAAEEEIDVSQCRNKADLVKTIKDKTLALAK